MNNGERDLSTKNLDVVVKLLENHMPVSLANEWLAFVTGRKSSVDMINSLSQSVMTEQYGKGSDYTVTQRLLNNLEINETKRILQRLALIGLCLG